MSYLECQVEMAFRCISCSSLGEELCAIFAEEDLPVEQFIIDSSLHSYPERLAAAIQDTLDEDVSDSFPTFLAFGDCHPGIEDQARRPFTVRLNAVNCIQALLGEETHQRLSEEGALFLLPNWVDQFRQILLQDTCLTEEMLAEFMQEFHKKLVYLDTGLIPVPEEKLQDLADYFGLPYEVHPTSLDNLRDLVLESHSLLVKSARSEG